MPKIEDTRPALVRDDPWLEPYEEEIRARRQRYLDQLAAIEKDYGALEDFAKDYTYLGLNYDPTAKGWWYREWAPAAHQLNLVGDFNGWNRVAHPLKKVNGGIWEILLPQKDFKKHFAEETKFKVHVRGENGDHDRLPAYVERVVQDPETHDFAAVFYEAKPFAWSKEFDTKRIKAPIIYEAHIGMATEQEAVGTYAEFTEKVLPRIKKLGYNTVQLMAVQEHPYYGSFGYHVSNFFAASSRFGKPEDLKKLIDTAHEMGIAVIMDLVHSHAVKNLAEGLNEYDGTDDCYFHPGGRGYHNSWDSKLFNYGKPEVLQFLLSNVRYWLEEYRFDGYRFDGITSMLYHHHGDHTEFDHYDKYFYHQVDWDSITYLQLANEVVRRVKPGGITIAEDFSGMPGLCRLPEDGGLGFGYRLGMGIPDYWIKLLKHTPDEDWSIHEIWNVHSNRRYSEKTIAYAESHDQAIVGDKTIAFWLMDKEMYWHMAKDDDHIVIDRGIALHKMLRTISASLGGEGYLNFIGNEFGHPEWIDFPREGNDWSYQYARRQWSLVDNKKLKYHWLNDWDRDMVKLLKKHKVLEAYPARQLNMDDTNKTIIYERANLLFIANLHPSNSVPDYELPAALGAGDYEIVLCSDQAKYGGHDRVDTKQIYSSYDVDGWPKLKLYVTSRTVMVLAKKD